MKKSRILLLVGLCGFGCYYYLSQSKKVDEVVTASNDIIVVDGVDRAVVSDVTAPKMRKFLHNKLWRDKGPIRMEKTGSIVHVTILDDEQYNHQLGLKLMEEADEVHRATTKEDLISEIGDVLEVLDAIIKLHDLSRDEIIADQTAKREERGGLYERQFVTMTESIPGTFLDEYCSKDPDKYKEILD